MFIQQLPQVQVQKAVILNQPIQKATTPTQAANAAPAAQVTTAQPVISKEPEALKSKPAPAALSLFHAVAQSIEICNNSNQVHKSNVRYLIDNVQNAINGPKLK